VLLYIVSVKHRHGIEGIDRIYVIVQSNKTLITIFDFKISLCFDSYMLSSG